MPVRAMVTSHGAATLCHLLKSNRLVQLVLFWGQPTSDCPFSLVWQTPRKGIRAECRDYRGMGSGFSGGPLVTTCASISIFCIPKIICIIFVAFSGCELTTANASSCF